MVIRDEGPADAPAVRAVVEAAFGRPLEADLIDRLRQDGDAAISLVAVDGGEVVGQVLFSGMAAPCPALALAPVSVAPHRQRSGVGTRLIRAGLDRAGEGGWRGVFVLGDPAYYRRFGFDPAVARGFASAYAGPHLMALALGGGDLPATGGRIDYAPAFAALAAEA
jgi:putative acetyltransferase